MAWTRRALIGLVAVALAMGAPGCGSAQSSTQGGSSGAVKVTHIVITSRYVHRRLPVTLVTPAGGGAGRPLLVFLHGRGGDANSELVPQLFAALKAAGPRAPDIAFPYGGLDSYWHNRASGGWGSYVLKEVIPTATRDLNADGRRVGIGGISMGGFGAYAIARSAPGRFCAVGGHSAAIFASAGLTAAGAFDDPQDFARNDLISWAAGRSDPYGRAKLWLDGGSEDPFHATDETFARELHIQMHVWPGQHDNAYWDAHLNSYIAFYANALATCRS